MEAPEPASKSVWLCRESERELITHLIDILADRVGPKLSEFYAHEVSTT